MKLTSQKINCFLTVCCNSSINILTSKKGGGFEKMVVNNTSPQKHSRENYIKKIYILNFVYLIILYG